MTRACGKIRNDSEKYGEAQNNPQAIFDEFNEEKIEVMRKIWLTKKFKQLKIYDIVESKIKVHELPFFDP